MGSLAAIQALQRGEVHIAGIHVVDPVSGEFNLPFMKKYLKRSSYTVVRFAGWEQGLMVHSGNPKRIHSVSDLGKWKRYQEPFLWMGRKGGCNEQSVG